MLNGINVITDIDNDSLSYGLINNDSIIINQSAIDRGLFMSTVLNITYQSIAELII